MKQFTLLFLLGTCLIQLIPCMPNLYFLFSAVFVSYLLLIIFKLPLIFRCYYFLIKYIAIILLGLTWVTLHATWILHSKLPSHWQNENITTVGTINSVPEQKNHGLHFTFAVQYFYATSHDSLIKYSKLHPLIISISWYGNPQEHVRVGDKWLLHLKLTIPRSYSNPDTFNYNEWLLEQKIIMTGTVINSANNLLIEKHPYLLPIDRFRQSLNERISEKLLHLPVSGMISALSLGIRNQITEQQWTVLRDTGTNHLMAIAGLHIGFIAGMTYWLANIIWRQFVYLLLKIPASHFAALLSLIIAIFYSALAGFALPTQRAIIMLTVFLLATLIRRNISSWTSWHLALLCILLWDPLATLSASFWMSFGTVALVIYTQTGRLQNHIRWWHWFKIQAAIAIGVIPLSLLFFQQISLLGIIANSIAIPWVGFIILPLCFFGTLLLNLSDQYGGFLLIFAEHLLNYLWIVLSWISRIPSTQWYHALNNAWIFFTTALGIVVLLAPQNIPVRWLGLVFICPLLFDKSTANNNHSQNNLHIAVLDSGPAMSVIIYTPLHAMIFQAHMNKKNSAQINESIISPFLLTEGMKTIDVRIADSTNLTNLTAINVLQTWSLQSLTKNWIWDNNQFTLDSYPSRNNKISYQLQIQNDRNIFIISSDSKINLNALNLNANPDKNIYLIVPYQIISSNDWTQVSNTHLQSIIIANYKNNNKLAINSEFKTLTYSIYNTQNCGAVRMTYTDKNHLVNIDCYNQSHKHFWDIQKG